MSKSIIFGTAGHIDHGKSSLVKALTGKDPDRLQEEKDKGITISLGYAGMDNDEYIISFVDVPGHEKFIKTMISGSVGFDAVLFCIDGREGIMPQTIEHFNILKTIGVKYAVAAVTKADKYPRAELDATETAVRKLFENSGIELTAVVRTSVNDEAAINRLKAAIYACSDFVTPKTQSRCYVIRADRIFSIKGHGTVVTGTSLFGRVTNDTVVVNILNGKKARVKNIQVHDKNTGESVAGQRTAINLPDFSVSDVKRGDLLTENAKMAVTSGFYAFIRVFDNITGQDIIRHNKIYPLVIGSDTYEAKMLLLSDKSLSAGDEAYCFIKLKKKIVVFFDEPFIVRAPESVAGGRVLALEATLPDRKSAEKALSFLRTGDWAQALLKISEIYPCGVKLPEPIQFSGLLRAELAELQKKLNLISIGGETIPRSRIDRLVASAMEKLNSKGSLVFGKPNSECSDLSDTVRDFVMNSIIEEAVRLDYVFDGNMLKRKQKDPFEEEAMNVFAVIKQDATVSNPQLISQNMGITEDKAFNCLQYLANRSMVRKIATNTFVTMELINSFAEKAAEVAVKCGGADINNMREHFSLPRKLLIPLMEQLDKTGAFINKNNKRFLKK